MALMEAMAVGLPVVSTLHSGIPELVEDARSGFIVPERDVDALRVRLKRLIAAPGDWPALGTAGRQRVEDAFNIHRQNDKLVETFLRLAGKKS